MKKSINLVLLIDDDPVANFLHTSILSKVCPSAKVVTTENGARGLAYLEALVFENKPFPELILLDINMPVLNGWEFLENYIRQKLNSPQTCLYLMLTTPLTETDQARSAAYLEITGYLRKPLTAALLSEKFS
jgi:CheY-like chemotaxis protein